MFGPKGQPDYTAFGVDDNAVGRAMKWHESYHEASKGIAPRDMLDYGVQGSMIKKALSEGKPVPPEVLAEYPSLKPPIEPAPVTLADAKWIAKQFPLIRDVTETPQGFEPKFDASTAMNKAPEVIAQREAFKEAVSDETRRAVAQQTISKNLRTQQARE